MKTFTTCLSRAIFCGAIFIASSNIANSAIIYSQDFNTLTTTTQAGVFSGTLNQQTAIPGLTGWSATRAIIAGGAGSATAFDLAASNGSSTASAIMSNGATGNSERALGTLSSGTRELVIGAEIVNNTGFPLSQITIAFTQETWRLPNGAGATTNTDFFGYGRSNNVVGLNSSNYLSFNSGMTPVAALNLVASPSTPTTQVDGNLPANQIARSAVINFATPLAIGESLFIRWQDGDDGGSDGNMAVDNFTISAVPEPGSMSLVVIAAVAGVGLIRQRRRK